MSRGQARQVSHVMLWVPEHCRKLLTKTLRMQYDVVRFLVLFKRLHGH